jgi:L-fuconolactonase
VLEAMIASGGGRFRDIRFITASHPDQAAWGAAIIRPARLLMDPKVCEGFARLAPLDFSWHKDQGRSLHRHGPGRFAFAGTRALNRPARPAECDTSMRQSKRDDVFSMWSGMIHKLATCPNVHIKLGGLGIRMFGFTHHLGELPPSSKELAAAWRPYIET